MEKYIVEVYADKTIWRNEKGEVHRLGDLPAIEYASGSKIWYLNGKLHRLDGPAVEYADGDKVWYLNGEELSEAEFNKKAKPDTCEGKLIEIDGKKYKLTRA